MDASVFVRQPNAYEYSNIGVKDFTVLPRHDEYISADHGGKQKYFQVVAVHHKDKPQSVEIYAVEAEPPWMVRKGRSIGFSS